MHQDDYVQTLWTPERRHEFLLNPDVAWPLSVDAWMWPSVFFSKLSTDKSFGTIEIDVDTVGSDYWVSLSEMRACYEARKPRTSLAVPIAIELWSEKPLSEDIISYTVEPGIECALWLRATTPHVVPAGSELLGYDIADASRISGLANCGYTEEDQRALRPVWGPRLNTFGLLETLDDAVEYRQVCDTRVREHAPFWIYAIWRLARERVEGTIPDQERG